MLEVHHTAAHIHITLTNCRKCALKGREPHFLPHIAQSRSIVATASFSRLLKIFVSNRAYGDKLFRFIVELNRFMLKTERV